MPLPRAARLVLVALPALVIAAAGTQHPILLDPQTAERWRLAHLVLLPAFPLLAAAVLFVLRGERGPVAWGARVAALAYAVLYGALDSIAGIGAPQQVLRAAERGDAAPPIGDLYEIGDQLGHLGVYGFAIAGALSGLVLFRRTRSPLALAGGGVLLLASYPFFVHHVFPPRGVLAMLAIGGGLVLLEASRGSGDRTAATSPAVAVAR